jgi:predicted TIM-barrel fold metal-dependent hydrolase
MNMYVPVHALGHPWGLAVNFSDIIYNGIFERFPRVRMAFLEGGIAWLLLCLERLHASHETHFQHIPGSEFGVREEQDPKKYIIQKIREGRIFLGCETEELTMPFALKSSAPAIPLFSDFPHEVTNESCKRDIAELMESGEITADDKAAILYRNAERFYTPPL